MRGRTGFTLVEVMVAMTIAAIVIVAAHQLFTGVAGASKAVAIARESLDRNSNARRWLKAAFLSLEPPFDGRSSRVAFKSWQLTSGGWFAPESVTLSVEQDRLIANVGGQPLPLDEGTNGVAFDYLLAIRHGRSEVRISGAAATSLRSARWRVRLVASRLTSTACSGRAFIV